jgi:hypothetical protein
VLTEPARLTALTAYMGDTGHGFTGNDLDWSLYKDENGVPTEPVYGGGTPLPEVFLDDHPDSDLFAPRWLNEPAAPVILQPGRYWFAIHTAILMDDTVSGGQLQYFADGKGNWYGGPDVPQWPAVTFTPAGGPGDGTISAFISYEPGPFVARKFGHTTAATKVADTLAQDYVHASRFTLADNGASITAVHAYMDGLGGGTGRQWFRAVIFNDIGAKQRIAFSGDIAFVNAGDPPGWVTIQMGPVALPKGNYWIGIQSGFPTSVARIYGDGVADELIRPREDNTGSGVNDFLDPPEDPAQRGNATLSIYLDYMVPQR